MLNLYIKTFGCKVNYAESVMLAEQLAELGVSAIEASRAKLDGLSTNRTERLVLVNTCCVTKEAERKAAQYVRRIKRDYPGTRILVTGCAARHQEIAEKLRQAGAHLLNYPQDVLAWARQFVSDRRAQPESIGARQDRRLNQPAHLTVDEPPAVLESGIIGVGRTRAFIKIQDGCANHCAFCIIPHVRPYGSRPAKEILEEIERRLQQGYRELVLCGINIGHYGYLPVADPALSAAAATAFRYERQQNCPTLTELMETILQRLPPGTRLRLSSVEPEELTASFFQLFQHPRMCPHLHLPLQSGSNRVLSAMNRRYRLEDYQAFAAQFRQRRPDAVLTTDLLVGFPTEDEDDFAQTMDACDELAFERVHAFPFSPRPGTPAAQLPPLPTSVVRSRNRSLIEHCHGIADQRWPRFLDKIVLVLTERKSGTMWHGHGPGYQVVRWPGSGEVGALKPVRLTEYADGQFVGEIAE